MTSIDRRTVRSSDGTTIAYRTTGVGEPVIVVGGVLRSADDYMPFASDLARRFEVHVVDRRGRGGSGPQGADYSIEKECDDLEAVIAQTNAARVFGHSFGGLVALETAKRSSALRQVAVYEPAVWVDSSVALDWLPAYAKRLDRGDTRGAFAELVRGSGHAPAIVSKLPVPCLKLVLRVAIKREQWQRMEPLLHANLVEHEALARVDGTAAGYGEITAEVLLLGGTKSPRSVRLSLDALSAAIPRARQRLIEGLAHNAPDETSPAAVAEVVEQFLAPAPPPPPPLSR